MMIFVFSHILKVKEIQLKSYHSQRCCSLSSELRMALPVNVFTMNYGKKEAMMNTLPVAFVSDQRKTGLQGGFGVSFVGF